MSKQKHGKKRDGNGRQAATGKRLRRENCVKILLCFVIVPLYYLGFFQIAGWARGDTVLYFASQPFAISLLVSCFFLTVFVIAFPVRRAGKWFRSHKKTTCLLTTVSILILVFPALWIRCGVLADSNGIRKTGVFGQTKQEYPYRTIQQIEVSVKYGIQYDITFENSETVFLASALYGTRPFENDENMIAFDQAISQYSQKYIDPSQIVWMDSDNIRRFFKTEEGFSYFDHDFRDSFLKHQKESG